MNNRIETTLVGPPNESGRQPAELTLPLVIKRRPNGDDVDATISGQTIRLRPGRYSEWVHLTFRCGWLKRVHGICRFRLESTSPNFRLYVTPINIDPERPAMPISAPLYYSLYLGKLHASFATLGLAEDMWALNSCAIDEEAFLEQAYDIHAEREAMFFDALKRMRADCACVCLTDRIAFNTCSIVTIAKTILRMRGRIMSVTRMSSMRCTSGWTIWWDESDKRSTMTQS